MPINPPVNITPNVYTARDIIVDAMIEIGMLAPGDESHIDTGAAQWAYRKLNYLLDEWAAMDVFVYSVGFQLFTLTPNHSPHTIGPGSGQPLGQTPADFPVPQRPVRIESAAILLPGTANNSVDVDLEIEDDDWWAANPVKSLVSSLPTHLYYSPDNPNGNCYFWPISNVAFQVRLQLWNLLAQFISITDPVDGPGGSGIIPPAYRQALMLTLAEQMQTGAGKAGDPSLGQRAMKARAAIMGNNNLPPRISTLDSGMPTPFRGRPRFNFLTREPY